MSGLQDLVTKISDPADIFGGQAAAAGIESSEELGYESLAMQQEWMDYLKSEYAPYSEVATDALASQVQLSGLGGPEAKQEMISGIEADPFFQAKLEAGEDAILRNKGATGGLRSGDAQSALALNNQLLLGNEIDARYNQLAGLSGQGFQGQTAMSGYGSQSIDQMSTTLGGLASGQLATSAAATNRGTGLLSGLTSAAALYFSDDRLKTNLIKVGIRKGFNLYTWTWNKLAEKELGLKGQDCGHLASEVEKARPELVVTTNSGFKAIYYGGL